MPPGVNLVLQQMVFYTTIPYLFQLINTKRILVAVVMDNAMHFCE